MLWQNRHLEVPISEMAGKKRAAAKASKKSAGKKGGKRAKKAAKH